MDIKSKKKNNDNISTKQDKKMRIVKWMWTIFVGMGLVGTFVLLLIYNGVIGYMPPIEELKNPHDKFASIVKKPPAKFQKRVPLAPSFAA